MRFPRCAFPSWLALVVLATALAGAPARAAEKAVPTAVPLTEAEASRLAGGLAYPCKNGVTGTAFSSIDYILPPDDQFYTLLKPPTCVECGGTNTVRLSNAHVVLNFLALCTVPITYSVVGADTGCAQPDLSNIICPPISANLVPPSVGLVDFTLSLPDSCQFTDAAFLCINFRTFPPACNTASNRPRMLLATGGCPACNSWNYFETEKDDVCIEPDALPGQPLFYAEAWSCYTPTLRRSWGDLKLRYR